VPDADGKFKGIAVPGLPWKEEKLPGLQPSFDELCPPPPEPCDWCASLNAQCPSCKHKRPGT
jgi:hypothetical protein